MGAAIWKGLHAREAWYGYTRTCHENALSHCVRTASVPTRAMQVKVGGSGHAKLKDIRSGIGASAFTHRGLRQPSNGPYGRPCIWAYHQRSRCAADVRYPSARNTSGALPSGRCVPMRRRRLCTLLCRCSRCIWSEIIFFILGLQL